MDAISFLAQTKIKKDSQVAKQGREKKNPKIIPPCDLRHNNMKPPCKIEQIFQSISNKVSLGINSKLFLQVSGL